MILYSHHSRLSAQYVAHDIPFEPLKLVTGHGFFDRDGSGKYDRYDVEQSVAERVAASVDVQNATGPVCLDCEGLKFDEDWEHASREFEKAISIYRRANPGHRFGFYDYLPRRNWWAPVNYHRRPHGTGFKERFDAWRASNARHRSNEVDDPGKPDRPTHGIADRLDVVFPSLYTLYDDPSGWELFAKWNLIEAARYQKPIIPWLWAVYHDGSPLKYQYIGDKLVATQLETCLRFECEGVVFLDHEIDNVPASFFDVVREVLK